jgi:hypothetical protein
VAFKAKGMVYFRARIANIGKMGHEGKSLSHRFCF